MMKKSPFTKALQIGVEKINSDITLDQIIEEIKKDFPYLTEKLYKRMFATWFFLRFDVLSDYTDGGGANNIWAVQIRIDADQGIIESEFDEESLWFHEGYHEEGEQFVVLDRYKGATHSIHNCRVKMIF